MNRIIPTDVASDLMHLLLIYFYCTGTLTKNEMTLVAFVTKGKRWIFNVEANERTAENFCVNEKYMATRADHTKFLKSNEIIKTGPSVDRKSRGSSFPFGITFGFGKTAHGGIEPEEPAHLVSDESTPEEVMSTAFNVHGEHPDPIYLRQILVGGILCSKCVLGENGGKQGEIGNPTELSILRAAYFSDVNVAVVKDSAPIIAEVPFSSEYKFMSTVHEPVVENDGEDYMDELIVHVKGAPDRLIPLCKYQAKCGSFAKEDLEPCDTNFWIEQIAVLSSHGLRVLALTRGSIPKGSVNPGDQLKPDFIQGRPPWLTIVGLCAIMDPPRPECVRAIAEAHRAGVRVAMITGDHKDTAIAIGGALGLVNKQYSGAITGPELDEMSDAELRIVVQKYNIFSRASPQNKIKIVVALQAEGEVCGMTGDGVVRFTGSFLILKKFMFHFLPCYKFFSRTMHLR
jgi:magnesium-transporting ATPase (P-type)